LGIVNSSAFKALSGDSLVTNQDANAKSQTDYSLAPMILRGVRGFDVVEYPQFPSNSEDLVGVFMAPGAVLGAVGVPADANMPGVMWPDVPAVAAVRVITDADTGLSLLERRRKDSNGGAALDYAWIYGFAKGNTDLLERVRSSQGS
jgi:hypothetical protein